MLDSSPALLNARKKGGWVRDGDKGVTGKTLGKFHVVL